MSRSVAGVFVALAFSSMGLADDAKTRAAQNARSARWEILFSTVGHADYIRQLNAIGAYVGFPDQTGNKLLLVRDLNERPVKLDSQDAKDIRRVQWRDTDAKSVEGVARLLGIPVLPSMMVTFIPDNIEAELFKAEMAYAKKNGIADEKDIKSTQFKVSFRSGKPLFIVTKQTKKIDLSR